MNVQVMGGNFNYLIALGIYYSGTHYAHFVSFIHISVLAQTTRTCNLRQSLCKCTLFQKAKIISSRDPHQR